MIRRMKALNDKSMMEDQNLEEIKQFIRYKYPARPSEGVNGEGIYDKVFGKVSSHWEEN